MCSNRLLFFIILLLSNIHGDIYSQSTYFTYLNKFGALHKSDMKIEEDFLCVDNMTYEDKINIACVNTSNSTFCSYIRFKNLNNKEGKKYRIWNNDRKSKMVENPLWGFVWNYQNEQNFYAIILKGYNTNYHDILDNRLLHIEINKIENGKKEILYNINSEKGIDVYDGFNVVKIQYDGYFTHIYIGNKELKFIHKIKGVEYGDSMGIGYIAGAGADLRIERIVHQTTKIKETELMTKWNKSNLDSLFHNKNSHIEGLWKYLDRNIGDKNIKLGGKYTLAVVSNTNGDYDIIYYDGATVGATKWKCGMLKGRLKRTSFHNNYDLIWYDSTMQEINDDTYAIIEGYGIMTLFFPVEKAQLRFIKQ